MISIYDPPTIYRYSLPYSLSACCVINDSIYTHRVYILTHRVYILTHLCCVLTHTRGKVRSNKYITPVNK